MQKLDGLRPLELLLLHGLVVRVGLGVGAVARREVGEVGDNLGNVSGTADSLTQRHINFDSKENERAAKNI